LNSLNAFKQERLEILAGFLIRMDEFPLTGSQGKEAPARRGGKAYLAASFAAQFCALARYTLLARLLGPEQLGIAVALILTSQFFESITDSGSDRFLVQDKQGDEPEVQGLVHLVWLGRGLMIGACLVALAIPLAQFYDAPELRTAFIFFALTPLIAGFAHLDYRRLQRKSDFRAESRALVSSEVVSLAVTGIVAYLTRDYTAIICGLIARSAVLVLVSHLRRSDATPWDIPKIMLAGWRSSAFRS
jgi:O-antigen/teichoic acid export membrane protein